MKSKNEKSLKKTILSHLKEDTHEFKEQIADDKKLKKTVEKKLTKDSPMKKQTKADKMDESLGMRMGKESAKSQSYKSRRDESKCAKKSPAKKAK